MHDEYVRSRASWFLDEILLPDVAALNDKPSDVRLAFHALTSTLELRDWLLVEFRGSEQVWGITDRSAFHQKIVSLCPDFQVLADAANASKHFALKDSKSVNHADDIQIREFGWHDASGSLVPWDGEPTVVLHDAQGRQYGAIDLVLSIAIFWRQLREANGWEMIQHRFAGTE